MRELQAKSQLIRENSSGGTQEVEQQDPGAWYGEWEEMQDEEIQEKLRTLQAQDQKMQGSGSGGHQEVEQYVHDACGEEEEILHQQKEKMRELQAKSQLIRENSSGGTQEV